ncbi:hypothetical protein HanRHA438_Chr11g0502161 [Helianthus annuus]|nr:hypothetical protein HanRHA438_Chr11g0502161 [Helianthus annuus]
MISWIMGCVTSAACSISINGRLQGYLKKKNKRFKPREPDGNEGLKLNAYKL